MDGQMDYEKYMKLMSLALGGNATCAPYVPEDDPSHHFLPAVGRNEKHSNAPPLPSWMYSHRTPHNYIEFLAENTAYDHGASFNDVANDQKASFNDVPEGNSLPVGSMHHPNGVSEIQILNNDSGKAHNFEHTVSNLDMVSWNVMPSLHVPNKNAPEDSITKAGFIYSGQNEIVDENICSVPMLARYLKPSIEGKPLNNFTNPQLRAQINTSRSEIPCKPCYSTRASKQKTTESVRLHKIAERLKALQELLPQSTEASQVSIMNDAIEYITYLQLQMKELSRSMSGGGLTSDPFVSLERYGHNLINEQIQNEPLEDMIGNMLEANPSAVTQLLESRGLRVMPIALAEELLPENIEMMPNTPHNI